MTAVMRTVIPALRKGRNEMALAIPPDWRLARVVSLTLVRLSDELDEDGLPDREEGTNCVGAGRFHRRKFWPDGANPDTQVLHVLEGGPWQARRNSTR